jgi:nucleoside phosphorylase
VCNIGFSGALDDSLEVGDIVVATAIDDGKGQYAAANPQGAGVAVPGIVATRDRIAATAAEKKAIREACGASVVEMEAAGAQRGADDLSVPFYCVRAVSDLANEDFANDFNAALEPDGRFSLPRLITGALASPSRRFAELMRLQKRTTLAANKLGEFLETCRF